MQENGIANFDPGREGLRSAETGLDFGRVSISRDADSDGR
jgi:hypothetical protein